MYAQPVVPIHGCQQRFMLLVQGRGTVVKIITRHIKPAGFTPGIFGTDSADPGCKNAIDQFCVLHSGIGRFIIIVYQIVKASLTCVAAIDRSPVVNDVVAEIHFFVLRSASLPASVKTGSTTGVVSNQIVVKTRGLSAPNAAITMLSFLVNGIGQAFTYYAPLQGKILIIVKGGTFIGTPAHGAVIHNNILLAHSTHGIVLSSPLISHSGAYITNNHIIGRNQQRIIFQTNTLTGSRLSGYG